MHMALLLTYLLQFLSVHSFTSSIIVIIIIIIIIVFVYSKRVVLCVRVNDYDDDEADA